ncbi:acylneuraminate cytidylyltransferase [Shewanella electrodiphila]|uniref:Acylneuraminate cytidylyltransferase n=1 Tax=Shewanella electrodiphila TaxID=934143 RepID=A0ABT0KMM3_9GAMM|nr:acylneuraminate cytidylyltransferase [Shewanella electrodiphila]
MTKTLALVGARLNSSRLPGKHLLSLSSEPMIAHIWRRIERCSQIDSSELATTADNFNQPLIDWASKYQISCHPFDGDVNDLMARLNEVISREAPDYILYICGDCPLIDPVFIDHGLKALKASGKDTVILREGIKTLHEGIAFYSSQGWNKLMAASQCKMSREHVGYADKLTPVLDKEIIDDSDDYSKINHRISVDTQADYRFMTEVYNRWYDSHDANSIVSLTWVQQQLIGVPQLVNINSHVAQKSANKQYAKASLYCHLGANIGLGHFRRVELIADALQEYLGIGSTIHVLNDGKPLANSSTKIKWYKTETQLLGAITTDSNPLLIFDFHPEFISLASLNQALKLPKKGGAKLIGIDKLSPLLTTLDWLFIPSFNNSLNGEKISAGWKNYLFKTMPKRDKKHQILVLTGGSDALGYGEELPSMLAKLQLNWPITWIQGPLAMTPTIPKGSNIRVLKDPTNLYELIAESDIILTCYGLSLFESIFSNAATLLLPPKHLCDDEELLILSAEKCCLISNSLADTCTKLAGLVANETARDALQAEAKRVFANHKGIKQLIDEITLLMTND